MKLAAKRPYTLLEFSGHINSQQVHDIENNLLTLEKEHIYKVIIDLTRAERICSSALGVFANYSNLCKEHNGEMRLVVQHENIIRLLEITMLDKIFETYETLQEAEEDFE